MYNASVNRAFILTVTCAVVWALTSVYHTKFTQEYGIGYTVGEVVANVGQTIGQICPFIALLPFVKVSRAAYSAVWFIIGWGIVDIIDNIFFNPYEYSIPKFFGWLGGLFTIILINGISRRR